jgi:4-hydroxy-tetrahydrodipicolinate synthase
MGPDFIQLSGEDGTALALMAHGGHGCISVTANIAPRTCADFQKACLAEDFGTALEIQDRLWALHCALFLETSPAPIKFAASLMELCTPDVRLPLVPIGSETEREVRAAMESAGLLS